MRKRNYRIAVVSVIKSIIENRGSFLRALLSEGARVRSFGAGNRAVCEQLEEYRPDFLLLFCMDYLALHLNGLDAVLSRLPYITVWDSTPLGNLFFLKKHRHNHLSLLVIDSSIAGELSSLGFHQADYFPYYYADPEVFKPSPPSDRYAHCVSFAGTFVPPSRIPALFEKAEFAWTEDMERIKNDFFKKRTLAKGYIDIYDFLKERTAVEEPGAVLLSKYLMFLQKWVERMQLFKTLSEAGIETHVYGGQRGYYKDMETHGEETLPPIPHIHIHDFIDKHRELPILYNNSQINLCCTQFLRACHERVFQASACNAFLLHEWKEDVQDLFEPGREIVLYRSLDELPSLIQRYRREDAQRKKIASRARERFLAEHTPLHRARSFLEICTARIAQREETQ